MLPRAPAPRRRASIETVRGRPALGLTGSPQGTPRPPRDPRTSRNAPPPSGPRSGVPACPVPPSGFRACRTHLAVGGGFRSPARRPFPPGSLPADGVRPHRGSLRGRRAPSRPGPSGHVPAPAPRLARIRSGDVRPPRATTSSHADPPRFLAAISRRASGWPRAGGLEGMGVLPGASRLTRSEPLNRVPDPRGGVAQLVRAAES